MALAVASVAVLVEIDSKARPSRESALFLSKTALASSELAADSLMTMRNRPRASPLNSELLLGLELMDGDLGAAQEAFKLLATEDGLGFVKNLTDRQVPTATSTVSALALWATDLRPFFKLITHHRAVDCASLEQEVSAIFNFVYGVGGARMERVFKFVTQLLPTPPTEATGRLSSSIEAIELSLDVLSKILDCNTMAIVDDKLSALTKIFSAAVNGLSRGGKDFSHLQSIKFLEYIRLRLDVGAEIGTLRDRPTEQVVRDQFVLRRDLLGRLSADGRRHDNDHANITKIQILPTYEEIVSPRCLQSEYLPTTDPSQWHVPGIRGRLDREFRLLREDTVGQLRDAVKETLTAITERQTGQASRGKNTTRTYTYESPTPESINMDRFGGLELVVRCNQPSALKNLNPKRREEWWSHSKRLQKGALVCLVDATGAVLFCVVSASTLLSVASDTKRSRASWNGNGRNDSNQNQTLPENARTLSDNEDFFYVSLQLAEPTNPNLTRVLRWYRNPNSTQVLFSCKPDIAIMSGRTLRSAANSAAAKISQATTPTKATPPKPAPKKSTKPPPPKTTPATTTATKTPKPPPRPANDPPTLLFPTPAAFDAWLATNGTTTPAGLFLQITKKSAPGPASLTYDQAVDTALCHGWIDGQRRALSATAFLQRFTPRRKRSVWSARNVAKVGVLEAEGRMREAGRREVEEAKGDGRWEAAYGGGVEVKVPRELEVVLEGNERARRGVHQMAFAHTKDLLAAFEGVACVVGAAVFETGVALACMEMRMVLDGKGRGQGKDEEEEDEDRS
ncbi:hypothetical protein B0T18DRAFT_395032 [Schizothecium vesticola]|uniref:Uncharacterized protein n=1 Tax=Schizothecium vesticola TaxID=314040 RepID=A0AA40BR04_9PEZI|nr:hypothetical protein B0T18DRAFT_395032 [Schizothecium vesticola]